MKRLALLFLLFVASLPLSSNAREIFYMNGGVDSVAINTTSYTQFYAIVHTDNQPGMAGTPEPGVPFTYQVDPSCGSFDGSASSSGVTDANGYAISAFLTGTALTLECDLSLTVEGVADPLMLPPVHVFSPAAAVYTPEFAVVNSFTGSEFFVSFMITESGLPVNLLPATVQIGTAPNGATATVQQTFINLLNSGRVEFRLLANDKQGNFTATSTNNGHTATLTVNQRKK